MSDDSVVVSTQSDEIARRNSAEIRPLREQNVALELEVLMVRDWAAAQGLRLGEVRRQQVEDRVHGPNYRAHIARLEAALGEASQQARQARQLRRELEALKASTTWKVGRLLLGPVRLLKRLLRRG